MVYGHANGKDLDETLAQAKNVQGDGLQGDPLAERRAGPGVDLWCFQGQALLRTCRRRKPTENVWSTSEYMPTVPKLFAAARETFGWDVHLLHDVHHRLDAARGGPTRQRSRAVPSVLAGRRDAGGKSGGLPHRFVSTRRRRSAVGEVFNSVWDAKQLLDEQLIDYIRTTIVHAGGISHVRRIAHLAELNNVRTGFHGATDLSPVCMGAALHFDLWVPNFGIQEYMRHTDETDAVFPHAYTFSNGDLHPGEAPGHGVDIDEALAAKYPYRPASLPVNRLEDGTLFNW